MELSEHAIEFAAKINQLDLEKRTHLRHTIEMLVDIYLSTDAQAIIVVNTNASPIGELVTINCNEMKAFEMVHQVHTVLEMMNTQDAPAKEMMN